MKVRFDTYTKSAGEALAVFDALSSVTDNLTLSISNWNGKTFNLHGEINSTDVDILEQQCSSDKWNEDASEL